MQTTASNTINSGVTRRNFVRAGSLLASAPLLYSMSIAKAAAATVSMLDYGAKGNGVADDTSAFIAALSQNLKGVVLVPAGTYLLRNPVTISGFCGRLECDPGARFLFMDATKPGLQLTGGSNAIIVNFRAGWQTPATVKAAGAALSLNRTTNTWVDGCTIENSNNVGVSAWVCKYPKISNTAIQNTLSTGLLISNCQQPIVMDVRATNTRDDGVFFVNYATVDANWGGYAARVDVSNAGGRGIVVAGQSHLEITDFRVNDTASSGLAVLTDGSLNTRVPDNVRIWFGAIRNAGTMAPLRGNQYGIEVLHVQNLMLSTISTHSSGHRGVSIYAPKGTITLKDIVVDSNRKDSGANMHAQSLDIDQLQVINAPLYGIYIYNTTNVVARRLETLNVAQAFTLRRAIWLEQNARIDLQNLNVMDDQAVPTGYIVGAYGANQAGTITGVTSHVPSGALKVDTKLSPLLVVTV